MKNLIEIQSNIRSRWNNKQICSFDIEVIQDATKPLIHQEARFILVNKGAGTIVIRGRRYDVSAGSLVSILPWEISEVTDITSPLQYYLLVYHFDSLEQIMKSFYNSENEPVNIIRNFSNSSVIHLENDALTRIKRIFGEIHMELGSESTGQPQVEQPLRGLFIINHLVDLTISFIRGAKSLPLLQEEDSTQEEDILFYIYTHLSERITLNTLSQIFYRSKSNISLIINRMTGLSLSSLCHEMRICKAANYLLYTDLTANELAEILGYVDTAHLSKVFSAKIGMKMSDYRKTYQTVTDICKIKETKIYYQLVEHIYRNHSGDISSKTISDALGISESDINKILLYQVEKNFIDFLNYIRINHACKLLLTTDKPMVEISTEVGYNTVKTFNRNFLKEKNMNPLEFRKEVVLQQGKLDDEQLF